MSSLPSIQTQWDTRAHKEFLILRWKDDFSDSETFQRQFREFVSNEQQGLEEVYYLRLEDCPLKGMGAEFRSLMEKLPELQSFALSYCEMEADDLRRARTAIKPNSLTYLHFYIATPSIDLLHEFVNFVSTQTELERLVVYASPESLEITKQLLATLKGYANLVNLVVGRANFDEDLLIDDGFVENLCEVLRNCRVLSVVRIVFGEYSLEDKWANLLLSAVSKHEYMRTFLFNNEADIFWDELRTSAETQVRNFLRSGYNLQYTMEITKLVFIGDGAVGKSSTVRTILGEGFVASHDSTLVLDLNSFATLKQLDFSFKKVAGDDYARFQYKFMLETLLQSQTQPVSKIQLQDSRFSFKFEQEAVQEVVQDDYFQELLKTGNSINKPNDHLMQVFDFGGQEVFYSLHHLLLTNSGIHVLVFNMEKTDTSDMQRVRFWMESVLLNAPNSMVIIVGTHFESFRLQSASSGTNLEDLLETVNQKIVDTHDASSGRLQIIRNERLSFFPLANSDGPGSAEAQSIINGIVRAVTGAAGFERSVLTMDIAVAEHMFMGQLLQSEKHMLRGEFFERAEQAGFDEEEVKEMLEKYTKVGLVLYFPDVAPEGKKSKNIVVLSPKWLTSALAKIVFDKLLHNLDRQVPTELQRDNARYLKTGVISKALLDFFWLEYTDQKGFLLECSIKMLVLVRFGYDGKEEYVVPSMLPENPIDRVGVRLNIPTEFHCAIYFERYMPLGFFPKIVSVFLEIAACSESSTRPLLSGSFCRIFVETTFVISLVVNNANNLVSVRLEPDESRLPKLLTMTEEVIETIKNSMYETNLEVVGLALAKKLPEENGQPVVKIVDVANQGNRPSFRDYMNHVPVNSSRFSKFQTPPPDRRVEDFDLFLSHAWGPKGETHQQVVKIEKLFAEQGLKCWIDDKYMRGNIYLDMLNGLKSSAAYVLFLADSFIARLENENNNVTREFFIIKDAKKRGKPVFLVALETHLTNRANWPPFSPLTFNFREEEVFDFSTEAAIEQNIVTFKNAVQGTENVEFTRLVTPKRKKKGCIVA